MSVLKVIGFNREGIPRGSGSATLWVKAESTQDSDARYLFISNSHVVTDFAQVVLVDPRHPTDLLPTEVLGVSQAADIAVLSVTVQNQFEFLTDLEKLKLKEPMVLESFDSVAEGYPVALPELTKSPGKVAPQVFNGRVVYQTSATLNQGNSGGALFDEDGFWRGVPYAVINGVGDVSFCVTDLEAISVAKTIVQEWRGLPIALQDMTFDLAVQSNPFPIGSVIATRIRVIEGFNEPLAIMDENVTATIPMCLRLLAPYTYSIKLNDGVQGTITTSYMVSGFGQRDGLPFLTIGAVHLAPLNEHSKTKFPWLHFAKVSARSLVVTSVDPDSPHNSLVGSIVTRINGVTVYSPTEAEHAVQQAEMVHLETSEGAVALQNN